jgi:hypothetical protein
MVDHSLQGWTFRTLSRPSVAGSQAMKDIMAASREAAEPKAKPPAEEAEDTQPEDE